MRNGHENTSRLSSRLEEQRSCGSTQKRRSYSYINNNVEIQDMNYRRCHSRRDKEKTVERENST